MPSPQVIGMLNGATMIIDCDGHPLVRDIICHLNSCEAHGGVHHFAVINEGLSVAVSKCAIECLEAAGLEGLS
jgi:hypothetical protein